MTASLAERFDAQVVKMLGAAEHRSERTTSRDPRAVVAPGVTRSEGADLSPERWQSLRRQLDLNVPLVTPV